MTRRRLLIGLAAALAVVFAAAGAMMWRMMQPPPADLDLSMRKPSDRQLYAVAIAPEAPPVKAGPLHVWILTLETPAGVAIDGARIAVDGGMPQHGHGLPTAPAVTANEGNGRYRIEGVKFNMGGWWELKFAVEGPAGADTVTFNLVL